MSDASEESVTEETETDTGSSGADAEAQQGGAVEGEESGVSSGGDAGTDTDTDIEALRKQVEEKYDFENFGPADMAKMSPEEWDVAFDDETWITGDELLARVEAELKSRIAQREVFAVLEYAEIEGRMCLVAYSESDYAIVYPDGSVEGRGTVLRDVKPTVALCSMEEYDVEKPPEVWQLPPADEIPESGSELGNWMLQLIAATQVLVGLAALALWPIMGFGENIVMGAVGILFVGIGLLLFFMVANARLSAKFQVREYRDRLRSIGTAGEERPAFLPIDDDAFVSAEREAERGRKREIESSSE